MTVGRRAVLTAAVSLGAAAGQPPAATSAPEPAGYRQQDYGAPTPLTLVGAQVLSTAQAQALWRARGAVFVDVLAQPPRPQGLPAGTIWRPRPRFDIPGSIWLADTGYGALAPAMLSYFRNNLLAVRAAVPGRLLVFYCRAGCWMSWNAAKRALELGLAPVAWYRDGTTGWEAAGLPLQRRVPEARPGQAAP